MLGDGLGEGAASDVQPTPVWANGQRGLVAWHRASSRPDGTLDEAAIATGSPAQVEQVMDADG
ncbi:MAG TPA: hypothetical protein VGD73_07010 [Pseudonocardia sp.]|uniref:hypothetical protein n=1 Tax=Pseudonocardia sp. TaxID=60912 RepID=UPI002EDA6D62